ncbi:unnamed protein product, partial [Porites evermanni]
VTIDYNGHSPHQPLAEFHQPALTNKAMYLNDNELKTLPSGIFSDLSSLEYL